ncbi:MAG: F0F1 ATP synthase subunit gamma [Alphaproteobacteria bacterium]|nr:F0F1 ATP synthase subunit gamma [Alphaproteobacteria bacterium]
MPSLRDYRDRIKSVKSTRKITSAMKMVAASKLRRAQEQAEASQPYAQVMAEMLERVAKNVIINAGSPKLLTGTGSDKKHLLVVVTADRGLCGGFNAYIAKETRNQIKALQAQGKEVSIVCVGRKGYDALVREYRPLIVKHFREMTGRNRVEYSHADKITHYILEAYENGEFDICSLIYNEFKSVLVQKPIASQLIPFKLPEVHATEQKPEAEEKSKNKAPSPYDFEPGEEEILSKILPHNLGVQIYRALLDSAAGEQAARMTAMDNATRNAGDMISGLTLQYNRARQAYITKELIEIISGAEAL